MNNNNSATKRKLDTSSITTSTITDTSNNNSTSTNNSNNNILGIDLFNGIGSISSAIIDSPLSGSKKPRLNDPTSPLSGSSSLGSGRSGIQVPPSPSVRTYYRSLLRELENYCNKLHFQPQTQKLAVELIHYMLQKVNECQDSLHKDSNQNHQLWIASSLWLAAVNTMANSNNNNNTSDEDPNNASNVHTPPKPHHSLTPSLTLLLTECKIALPLFTKHLNHCLSHFRIYNPTIFTDKFNKQIEIFEYFLIASISVYLKYEKIYPKLFENRIEQYKSKFIMDNTDNTNDLLDEFNHNNYYRCIWLFYLIAKNEFQFFGSDAEMYSLYITLTCVIKLALVNLNINDNDAIQLICTIAGKNGVELDNELLNSIKQMYTERFDIFLSEMVERKVVKINDTTNNNGPDYSTIFHPHNLLANATSMGLYLDKQVYISSDTLFWLDERLFLNAQYKQGLGLTSTNNNQHMDDEKHTKRPSSGRQLFKENNTDNDMEDTQSQPSSQTSNNSNNNLTNSQSNNTLHPPSKNSDFIVPASPQRRKSTGNDISSNAHATELAFSPALQRPNYPSVHPPPTPVSRMMESVSWLANKFRNYKPEPSPQLRQLLATQTTDPTNKIVTIIDNLAQLVVFPSDSNTSIASTNDNHNNSALFRRSLALKIYYRILESMLIAEKARMEKVASASNTTPNPSKPIQFSAWLLSKSFHSSVLALCFHIVINAYKTNGLKFNDIVTLFNLKWWDLIKVIESTLKHLSLISNNSLPTAIKTDLRDLEYSILQYYAWNSNETLPQLLQQQQYKLAIQVGMHPEHVAKQPRPNAVDTLTNTPNIKPNKGPNDTTVKPANDANSSALLLFYRKLFLMCGDRISILCSSTMLNVSYELEEGCWWLTCYILLSKQNLIINRHIDIIILCSIYTILVKVCKLNLDFKRIITLYLTRWEVNANHVVREIYSEQGKPNINIINFYNNYFISVIKEYALEVIKPRLHAIQQIQLKQFKQTNGSNNNPTDNTSRVLDSIAITPHLHSLTPDQSTPMPRRPNMSPKKISKYANVYLSPLRYSNIYSHTAANTATPIGSSSNGNISSNQLSLTNQNPIINPLLGLTPQTKTLYAFGESPRRNLHQINDIINNKQPSQGKNLFGNNTNTTPHHALQAIVQSLHTTYNNTTANNNNDVRDGVDQLKRAADATAL